MSVLETLQFKRQWNYLSAYTVLFLLFKTNNKPKVVGMNYDSILNHWPCTDCNLHMLILSSSLIVFYLHEFGYEQ